MHRIAVSIAVALTAFLAGAALGQAPTAPPAHNEVIRAIIDRFETTYVFPEVSRRVRVEMEKRIREGAYRDVAAAFAEALTRDLRAITADQHVLVKHSEKPFPPMSEVVQTPTPQAREETRRQMASFNYGFLKVERLPGNIGFLDLDYFADPDLGGATATAAMSFLAETDALIVDLRYNGGGNSRMVALLASYLFEVCSNCGGPMKVVAFITQRKAIRAILASMRKSTAPASPSGSRPPPCPARLAGHAGA